MHKTRILRYLILSLFIILWSSPQVLPASLDENKAGEFIYYYLDLLRSGNFQSAAGLWEPTCREQASRLGLAYDNITIKADGYFDGNATVNLGKNQSVHINLQPAMATIVPTKPHPDFKVFVDGRQIFEPEMVQPGEHTIQYSIGALQTQSTFYLEAGQTYRIEPVLSINFGY